MTKSQCRNAVCVESLFSDKLFILVINNVITVCDWESNTVQYLSLLVAGLQLLLILSCIQGILLFARLRGRDSVVDPLCNATKLDQSHLVHRLFDFGFVLINVLLLIKPQILVCGSPNTQIHWGKPSISSPILTDGSQTLLEISWCFSVYRIENVPLRYLLKTNVENV